MTQPTRLDSLRKIRERLDLCIACCAATLVVVTSVLIAANA